MTCETPSHLQITLPEAACNGVECLSADECSSDPGTEATCIQPCALSELACYIAGCSVDGKCTLTDQGLEPGTPLPNEPFADLEKADDRDYDTFFDDEMFEKVFEFENPTEVKGVGIGAELPVSRLHGSSGARATHQ